ncbi:MAG: GGDEF domain-containing protein [Pseudomonadota bacterium]
MHKTLEELLGDEAGSEPWLSHLDDLAARRPFFGADGEFKGYRGVTHDITELEEARRANAWNANHDALTRLSNRRFWNSELPKSSREGAVLMLDMDKFKAINDTLGHDVGDRLLQHVGDVLRASVRDNDVVARLGGDEFAILIRRTISRRQAAIIAQRILKALDRPIVLQGCTVHTSMSIGISVWASQADRLQEQVTLADGALYAAKKNGRNAYVISDKDERLPEALSA